MTVQTLSETKAPRPETAHPSSLIEVEAGVSSPQPGRSLFSRDTRRSSCLDGVRLNIRKRQRPLPSVGERGRASLPCLRVLLGLDRPKRWACLYNSKPILEGRATRYRFCTRMLRWVYQDARGSLDPRMTIGALIAEPLGNFNIVPRSRRGRTCFHTYLIGWGCRC